MRRIRSFALFCYDFVVGDDWRLAVGVILGLVVTAGLAQTSYPAWWVLPAWSFGALVVSLRRVVRSALRRANDPAATQV